jgi:hypothetical protein
VVRIVTPVQARPCVNLSTWRAAASLGKDDALPAIHLATEILRGLLAPFGHGLWTAILGGLLFATTRAGRFRLTGSLVLGYLGVSLLHALWDSMHGIAVLVTFVLTSTAGQQRAARS